MDELSVNVTCGAKIVHSVGVYFSIVWAGHGDNS